MKRFIFFVASLINIAASVVYIAVSPYDVVPTHWNFQGVADGFMSKWTMLFMPVTLIILSVAYVVTLKIFEKRGEDKNNSKYAGKIFLAVFLFWLALSWLFLSLSMNKIEKLGGVATTAVLLIMGAIIIFIGNLMPKLGKSSMIGVRTKSTLSNETVWRKTNKLAGYLGVICGAVFMILGAVNLKIGKEESYLIIVAVALAIILLAIIPGIYAIVISKKIKKE